MLSYGDARYFVLKAMFSKEKIKWDDLNLFEWCSAWDESFIRV